jgi:hypothetical protein
MVTRNQTAIDQSKKSQSSVKPKVTVSAKRPAAAPGKPLRATKMTSLAPANVEVAAPTQAVAKLPVVEPGTKSTKPKKAKLVRDSFTIPKAEYVVLDELKQRALALSHPAKKGELIRAGIKALAAMSDAAFLTAMKAVPAIKTGRPASAVVA